MEYIDFNQAAVGDRLHFVKAGHDWSGSWTENCQAVVTRITGKCVFLNTAGANGGRSYRLTRRDWSARAVRR